MTLPRANSVGAVVVTHNRLPLLQQCLRGLRGQTEPPYELIIVDNDSTDGTRQWLNEQAGLHVILQANLGGAGGFYTGIKKAFEQGHDWIWCMDDDGYPSPDCLASLLEVDSDRLRIRAPLVLAPEETTQLAFVLRPPEGGVLETAHDFAAAAQNDLVWGVGCPFNGILIHREVIAAVGLPIPGMFLWGDETEYILRTRRAGYRMATVGAARFYHPYDRMAERSFTFCGRRLIVMHVGQKLRDYLAIRNRAYIFSRYFGLGVALRHAGRHAVFYSKVAGLRGMLWAVEASWAGLRGNWRGHQRYLTSQSD